MTSKIVAMRLGPHFGITADHRHLKTSLFLRGFVLLPALHTAFVAIRIAARNDAFEDFVESASTGGRGSNVTLLCDALCIAMLGGCDGA